MYIKCDECGLVYEERNMFSVYRVEEIKGRENENLLEGHKDVFSEEIVEYYCYTCAAKRGLINHLRRQRPRKMHKHERKTLSNLKLEAKNAIELTQMLKKEKSGGKTLHGLIDIIIMNYPIIKFPAGLRYVPYRYDVFDEIQYAVTPQTEFGAHVLLSDQLGKQHASHVMWEGGSFGKAKGRVSRRYLRTQRYLKKKRKISDLMINRLNTLREKAMKKEMPLNKVEDAFQSTKCALEIFATVHWELITKKIRPIFAYYLYKTGMKQLQIAEHSCSLFPHMNRKTFMKWGKICERFEKEERNLHRQHLV